MNDDSFTDHLRGATACSSQVPDSCYLIDPESMALFNRINKETSSTTRSTDPSQRTISADYVVDAFKEWRTNEMHIISRQGSSNQMSSLTGLSQLTINDSVEGDDNSAYDDAHKLLLDCLHREKRSNEQHYEKAERAMKFISKYSLTDFGNYCRGLVYFPKLLQKFLQIHREKGALIADDDLGSMFCRCIEHQPEDTFMKESLEHLIEFKGDRKLEIKLLPGKYSIDQELYDFVKNHDVQDRYYDAAMNAESIKYEHIDVVAKEIAKSYTGFRDAYHALLYGGKEHLQSLIVRWDLWGDDRTADAAREFFNLDIGCQIEPVKARINTKCTNIRE